MMNATHEAALRLAADMTAAFDATLTPEDREVLEAQPRQAALELPPQMLLSTTGLAQAQNDFDTLTVADALEELAGKIEAVVAHRMDEMYRKAMHAYYIAEELSQDPAHADLIPHVKAMRAAHEAQYGYPIPPKVDH